jgi:LPXTG-motif cell wall-anchored protein
VEDGGVQAFGAGIASVSLMSTIWIGYTDENGNYDIPSLPYGNYVLRYTMPEDLVPTVGGETNGIVYITIDAPSLTQDAAGAGYSALIDAKVIYNDTKEPVPFCEVFLQWSSSDGELDTPDDVFFPITCDAQGTFSIEGLISGTYKLVNQDPNGYPVNPNVITVAPYSDVVEPTWELVRSPYPEPTLPHTGLDQFPAGLAALAILLMGTAAMVVSRRRRHRSLPTR